MVRERERGSSWVHGLGLEVDEYSVLAPRFSQRVEPGMVIAFEPMSVFLGRGTAGLEGDCLVTITAVERLTITDQTVIRIQTPFILT